MKKTKRLTLQLPKEPEETWEDREVLAWEPAVARKDNSEEDTAIAHAFLNGDDEVLA